MKPEEEKQIIEAINSAAKEIARAAESTSEAMKRFCERITQSALAVEPAAPVEKEYRAGEWVPPEEWEYWYITDDGEITDSVNARHAIDSYRLSQGNVFPTEAIAKAAKKHAEFWRAFDMADEDEGYEIYARRSRPGKIGTGFTTWRYGCPKFKSEESARAWVDSHGGEAYVSEMLIKGRAFRFKWGGE